MKLLTLAPAARPRSKKAAVIPDCFKERPRLIPHGTYDLEGTRYSRTLYTSKALNQSNFIIWMARKTGMHFEQAGPAACP
jgi:hypothetical protein